jgi:2,3-bisphosphoglycerate-independent phosphoglycerate mutase
MTDFTLQPHPQFAGVPGPVLTVVMDGVGLGRSDEGNAVHLAHTPVLDALGKARWTTTLRAHGVSVGLPSDEDMGNSEVGHNALGAGASSTRARSGCSGPSPRARSSRAPCGAS